MTVRRPRAPLPRSGKLVPAIAMMLQREGLPTPERLVFTMARAAGARFTAAAARAAMVDLCERPRRKRPPRNPRDRARRLLIAAYLAIERVEGPKTSAAARARAAARAAGASFANKAAATVLWRFTRKKPVPRNLRQYAAICEAVAELEARIA